MFHLGALTTAEGTEVSVGRLIAGIPHADPMWGVGAVFGHYYSDTSKVAADVRAGEDAYGIWVAGALRPDISELAVRVLKASPLSGDWREDRRGRLELTAALAVNAPGFSIPRPTALVASMGNITSMFAVGLVAPRQVVKPGTKGALPTSELAYLKERKAATEKWAAVAQQVETRRQNLATARDFAQRRKLMALAAVVKEMR
jgi:hypothetical protein